MSDDIERKYINLRFEYLKHAIDVANILVSCGYEVRINKISSNRVDLCILDDSKQISYTRVHR